MTKFRVFTGPTQVEQFAARWARLEGVEHAFAGTENVWLETRMTQAELSLALPNWARPVQMSNFGG
jgi:hypothetical protein